MVQTAHAQMRNYFRKIKARTTVHGHKIMEHVDGVVVKLQKRLQDILQNHDVLHKPSHTHGRTADEDVVYFVKS